MLWGRLKGKSIALLLTLFFLSTLSYAAPNCRDEGQTCSLTSPCCATDDDGDAMYCGVAGTCAAVYSPPVAAPSQPWWGDIYIWTAVSVMVAAAFLALAFMIGRALQLAVLDAWVKIEVAELVTSVLLAVFCVALIASVNGAAQFLTGQTGTTDIIGSARSFLQNEVYADGQFIYLKLSEAYFSAAKIASYTYTVGISVTVVSRSTTASPAAGLSPLVGQIGQGLDTVANFMLLSAAQSAFLNFFGTAAAVMMPVAIFLRSFSLTRKIGGTLLAAVIGATVIYPAGFAVSQEVYRTFSPDLMAGASNIRVVPVDNPPAAGLVCNPFMQSFVQGPLASAGEYLGGELGWGIFVCTPICLLPIVGQALCSPCFWFIENMFVWVKAAFPILVGTLVLHPYADDISNPSYLMGGYYQPLADYGLPAVAKYSVLSTVVFLIPLIIAVVMIRNLAITFGGEPQLYGLSKLI